MASLDKRQQLQRSLKIDLYYFSITLVLYPCCVREFSPLELVSSDKKSRFYKVAHPSPVGNIGSAGSSSAGSGSASTHHAGSSSSHTHHHHHSSTSSSSFPGVPGHKLWEEWKSGKRLNY